MPRVKRGNVRRAKRKKLLARAKGFYQTKSKLYRSAKESVDTALKYAFVGRRRKKRDFRRLWVMRINAAARENGLTYGQLIAGLKAAGNPDRSQDPRRPRGDEPGGVRDAGEGGRGRDGPPAAHARGPVDVPVQHSCGRERGARPVHDSTQPMSDPASQVDDLRAQFERDVAAAGREAEIRAVRDRYLARKGGLVSALLKALGSAPADERPRLGQLANQLKQEIEARLAARFDEAARAQRPAGAVDVTLPGRRPGIGHRHPLTILRERVEAIFTRFGFLVIEGPELEDDYHNFEALNMPPEHPARDMQDTLYLAAPVRSAAGSPATLLRTHTSGHADPLHGEASAAGAADRAGPGLPPGRFRSDPHADVHAGRRPGRRRAGDARRPQGHAGRLRPRAVRRRSRRCGSARASSPTPSRAPRSTSAAAGAAAPALSRRSPVCRRRRCAMCKRTGWLEILGSGMVHPAVFEAVGYDPERYTGFAFGMGLERVALLKWGVEDIRLFYENDLRFLEQFPL